MSLTCALYRIVLGILFISLLEVLIVKTWQQTEIILHAHAIEPRLRSVYGVDLHTAEEVDYIFLGKHIVVVDRSTEVPALHAV